MLNNNDYNLKLWIDSNELDYYTDVILELSVGEKRYVLLKDNILYLTNIVKEYVIDINMYNLDKQLNESTLGLLYNEYFHCIYEDVINDSIIFDVKERWIGEKYCCFSHKNYATWLYKYNNSIFMKVTPLFKYFDEEKDFQEYLRFIEEYSDIFTITITMKQLESMLEILLYLSKDI